MDRLHRDRITRDDPSYLDPHILTDLLGHQCTITCEDLDLDTIVSHRSESRFGALFGWIEESKESDQYHVHLFVSFIIVFGVYISIGDSDHTKSLCTQIIIQAHHLITDSRIEDFSLITISILRTDSEYLLRSSFHDETTHTMLTIDDRRSLAKKIIRHFIDSLYPFQDEIFVCQDCRVHDILDPCFEETIDICFIEDMLRITTMDIEMSH